VYCNEHDAIAPVPVKLQGAPEKVPVLLVVTPTVPVGVIVIPFVVSATVAVQFTATPIRSVDGQATEVDVVTLLRANTLVLPELAV
jgi:hypothetical protein